MSLQAEILGANKHTHAYATTAFSSRDAENMEEENEQVESSKQQKEAVMTSKSEQLWHMIERTQSKYVFVDVILLLCFQVCFGCGYSKLYFCVIPFLYFSIIYCFLNLIIYCLSSSLCRLGEYERDTIEKWNTKLMYASADFQKKFKSFNQV